MLHWWWNKWRSCRSLYSCCRLSRVLVFFLYLYLSSEDAEFMFMLYWYPCCTGISLLAMRWNNFASTIFIVLSLFVLAWLDRMPGLRTVVEQGTCCEYSEANVLVLDRFNIDILTCLGIHMEKRTLYCCEVVHQNKYSLNKKLFWRWNLTNFPVSASFKFLSDYFHLHTLKWTFTIYLNFM